jgi:hypothetical protein
LTVLEKMQIGMSLLLYEVEKCNKVYQICMNSISWPQTLSKVLKPPKYDGHESINKGCMHVYMINTDAWVSRIVPLVFQ